MLTFSEPPLVEPVLPQLGHSVNSSVFELFCAGIDPVAFGLWIGWGGCLFWKGDFAARASRATARRAVGIALRLIKECAQLSQAITATTAMDPNEYPSAADDSTSVR
jgi:hypothetical protein